MGFESIIKRIVNVYIGLAVFPLKIMNRKGLGGYALSRVCEKIEAKNEYISCRVMPRINNIGSYDLFDHKEEKIGILLQGPVIQGVTLENILYYKKNYKNMPIVLSTWEGEREDIISIIRSEGIIVVQSKKPTYSGILNVNFQIISARAGILKLKEIGVEYVAKTRSDQCIRKQNVFQFLVELLKEFPSKSNKIESRIVVIPTFFGNMFTPYFVSDFFYFGKINDLDNLFRLELDMRQSFTMPSNSTRRDFSREMYPPEILILKSFVINILGGEGTDTIKEYWQILKDYFICIDRSMIDLFTTKYDYSRLEHINNSDYSASKNTFSNNMNFGFVNWLCLYKGVIQYDTRFEKEADCIFRHA